MRTLTLLEKQSIFGGRASASSGGKPDSGSSLGEYIGTIIGAACGAMTRGALGATTCAVAGLAAKDGVNAYLALPDNERPVLPNLGFH